MITNCLTNTPQSNNLAEMFQSTQLNEGNLGGDRQKIAEYRKALHIMETLVKVFRKVEQNDYHCKHSGTVKHTVNQYQKTALKTGAFQVHHRNRTQSNC